METPKTKCPKCESIQLSANKKGFSGKKAIVGGILTGGIGLLAGTIGSSKIIITCLNCGHQFGPPMAEKAEKEKEEDFVSGATIAILVIIIVIAIIVAMNA